MEVVFFPDNKLGATVEPIYNGHTAIVSQNTDRLKDNKFEKAEIELFRNNIQGTSFLNPRGAIIGENANYSDLITRVAGTDRISFGIYYNTDSWISPITNDYQQIPDYYLTTWTTAGASVFKNAVSGQSKPIRYPNHGQQMYDISDGDYGFDLVNGVSGVSNLKETTDWTNWQINELMYYGAKRLSSISYMNGRPEMNPLLVPYFLFGRNSVYSWTGSSKVDYYSPSRLDMISRQSSTRTWDAPRESRFPNQSDSILYTESQIQLAIDNNGWFSDFMHWHSLYEISPSDLDFFGTFYSSIRSKINGNDVWCAGNDEASEYYFIRESIRSLGSFENDGKVYLMYEIFDKYKYFLQGISQNLDISLLKTPVSIRVDLSGTSLSGKNIKCNGSESIRSLGSDVYIINLPYKSSSEGFAVFELEDSVSSDYYSDNAPIITILGNTITTDINSKLVIWRKITGSDDNTIREVYRNNELGTSFSYIFESGYSYYIGAISKYRHSSLIEI
jgi:hypothetical protein